MKAQKYRHRVHIQEPTDSQNPTTGKITRSWATFYLDSSTPLDNYPAEVLTGPGKELHAAGTKLAETTARMNFRWFPGLRPDMRIIWDSVTYEIVSIERDATGRREYRLRCKEGLTDGT